VSNNFLQLIDGDCNTPVHISRDSISYESSMFVATICTLIVKGTTSAFPDCNAGKSDHVCCLLSAVTVTGNVGVSTLPVHFWHEFVLVSIVSSF
jgi:hypothetical protein